MSNHTLSPSSSVNRQSPLTQGHSHSLQFARQDPTATAAPQPHGGRLGEAVQQFGRPREQWLDLSTGISPWPYPVPSIPIDCWQRLPEVDDGLESAASDYYQSHSLLPVAGSQAAIQLLPKLRPPGRIAIIDPGYNEHRAAWLGAGHQVASIKASAIEQALEQVDVLLLINPNNPGAEHFQPQQLLQWHQRLQRRGGWLIVDEAFIDATPDLSLTPFTPRPGLIILRSIGKFFGLAGIRCGFVFAEAELLIQLQSLIGPWTITGPSRYLCRQALLDVKWQDETRRALAQQSQRLNQLLAGKLQRTPQGTSLFQQVHTPRAGAYYTQLAESGILTRLFPEPQLLRFGLPGSEADWQRLTLALEKLGSAA